MREREGEERKEGGRAGRRREREGGYIGCKGGKEGAYKLGWDPLASNPGSPFRICLAA